MNNEAVYQASPVTGKRITALFSRTEIQQLTARSDWMGLWAVVSTWSLIAGAFALAAWGLGQSVVVAVPVIVLAIALLGGRQLALAIITHEATHNTLFRTRWLNGWPTDWLCARPVGLDLEKYRRHHFIHHTRTGTDDDSDISLIEGLPTTRRSLARKFLRDLAGITGAKFLLGRFLMDAGYLKWTVATDVEKLPRQAFHQHLVLLVKNMGPMLLTNGALYLVLAWSGYPELYLCWAIAYLIPYPLFLRIRALAEHAGTERCADMFRNTRTTRAGVIARTFVAPMHVNFHLEHHAMASVPWFRLGTMHRKLREKDAVPEPPGYWRVMGIVSSA